MKKILIIGGTRNMGYYSALRLLQAGHEVTVLNRGMTRDELPDAVNRLRADRTDPNQLRRALLAKSFDVVLDFVLYSGTEAEVAVDLFRDAIDHYIFISSGQVYLVREDIRRPFHEDDYAGRLQPPPKEITYAYEEWRYGIDKRAAEDVLAAAHDDHGFPYTSLRLPMVNSERDPFQRLYSYIIRLKDGGPILVPETPEYPLRHIYAGDVIDAVQSLVETGKGKGQAYNLSQDETVSIDEFLAMVGGLLGINAIQVVRVPKMELQAQGFLPDCSPFSDRWMSELTNERSKAELDIVYTPLPDYLEILVNYYEEHQPPAPVGYKRRTAERKLAERRLTE